MDKRNKKISPTSIPQKRKHVVRAGSISALKMDPDSIIIKDVPNKLSGVQLNQTHNSLGTFGVLPGDETSIGEFLVPRIPDDIVDERNISDEEAELALSQWIQEWENSNENDPNCNPIFRMMKYIIKFGKKTKES